MNNLRFSTENIEKRNLYNKIKFYKTCASLLWIFCLTLFICFIYIKYKNSILVKSELNYNTNTDKIINSKIINRNKNESLITFSKFTKEFDNKLNYQSVIINKNQIELDIVMDDKKNLYKVIEYIENIEGCGIINILPAKKDNNQFAFKLLVEVKQ